MWLPVFLWALLIFYLSSQPQKHASDFFLLDFIIKKSAHVGEYAVLYFLVFRATQKKWLTSLLIVLSYAISDEIHQAFVPGRTSKASDAFGFDMTGAIMGAFIIWITFQIRQKKLQK